VVHSPGTSRSLEEIKLNDFARLWEEVGGDAESAFRRVGESGWYILGREVQAFESQLASFSRCPRAVGCASGLDAIELALRALDLQPGDRVLTTPLSAFATSLAILRAGGVPVYVDVDEEGLLDLDLAERALRSDRSLRAMVPVHLYGRSLDLERLAALRDELSLKLVEDMAQALGATWRGEAVGSVGQAAALSFYPTKNLGCFGDGGAVLCASAELANRCRSLRDYGQSAKYVHDEVGMNSRLDEVQAALMSHALLPQLPKWTQRRREIARRYGQEIRHPEVALPQPSQESVWHLYVLRATDRDGLMAHLKERGVQSAVHYPGLIPDQKAMLGRCPPAELPRARRMAATVLSLPIHPYLREDEVERVIQAVNGWRA
jgi:dTDP-3-amino-3,4,6-trideoxy-alpha-D-glucose transaminase